MHCWLLHLSIWWKFHRDTVTQSAVLCCHTILPYVVIVHDDLLSLTCISCICTKISHVFCKLFINVIMMMEWSHFAKIFRCNGFRGYKQLSKNNILFLRQHLNSSVSTDIASESTESKIIYLLNTLIGDLYLKYLSSNTTLIIESRLKSVKQGTPNHY